MWEITLGYRPQDRIYHWEILLTYDSATEDTSCGCPDLEDEESVDPLEPCELGTCEHPPYPAEFHFDTT